MGSVSEIWEARQRGANLVLRTAVPAVFAWFFGASGVLITLGAHARVRAASGWLGGFTALLPAYLIIAAVVARCRRREHCARALEFDWSRCGRGWFHRRGRSRRARQPSRQAAVGPCAAAGG
jgi:hypothetical protein